MDHEKPFFNPYVGIFVAVAAVSTSAIFVKLTSAPAAVIAFYRLFFAVLIMSPWMIVKHMPLLKRLTKHELLFSSLAGMFLAIHFILWFKSLDYTSIASSVVLVTLQPLFAFWGTMIFFKETYNLVAILGGVISIIGSFVIGWGDFSLNKSAFFGDILALLACGMITAYLLIGQRIRRSLHIMVYTYTVYTVATIILFLYTLAQHLSLAPYPTRDWIYFILLAIFPTLLGHSIFNWSVKWVSASVISMSILGEPIGASVLAYIILNEVPSLLQIIGGIIILFGIGLFLYSRRSKGSYKKGTHHLTNQQTVDHHHRTLS